jgi:hypothetical protein
MTLCLVPITLREARAYVARHHRHHRPPQGGIFAIGVTDPPADPGICGVVIVGRPVARRAQDGWTAEVTRLCTTGKKNACSFLYAAAWRAARAMGYVRMITYTLSGEPGVSLRAAGWRLVGETSGGTWSRKDRPRVDTHPTQQKLRWEAA